MNPFNTLNVVDPAFCYLASYPPIPLTCHERDCLAPCSPSLNIVYKARNPMISILQPTATLKTPVIFPYTIDKGNHMRALGRTT